MGFGKWRFGLVDECDLRKFIDLRKAKFTIIMDSSVGGQDIFLSLIYMYEIHT